MTHLKLKYLGNDSWDRPTYRDQYNNMWKDVSLGKNPSLSTLCDVENFEDEPSFPITEYPDIESFEIL